MKKSAIKEDKELAKKRLILKVNYTNFYNPSDHEKIIFYENLLFNWELWLKYMKGKRRRLLRRRIKKCKKIITGIQDKINEKERKN